MPFQHAITALEQVRTNAAIMSENGFPKPPDFDKSSKSVDSAITYLKVANLGGLSALVSLVRQWGQDRHITGPSAKATVHTQFEKLREEFMELEDAIAREDQHELIDAVGDMTVVLILLSELAGVKYETCLVAAYDEIKDRKGSMVSGAFVKQIAPHPMRGEFGTVVESDGTERPANPLSQNQ